MTILKEKKQAIREKVKIEIEKKSSNWLKVSNALLLKNLSYLIQQYSQNGKLALLLFKSHFYGEPEIDNDFLKQLESACFFPRCLDNGNLKYYLWPCIFETGAFGIQEPVPAVENELNVNEYDLLFCIIPGIAFDKKGTRLGRGKGMYDRFISSCKSPSKLKKIGICWDLQFFDELPKEQHDQIVDYIVTEKELHKVTDCDKS